MEQRSIFFLQDLNDWDQVKAYNTITKPQTYRLFLFVSHLTDVGDVPTRQHIVSQLQQFGQRNPCHDE